MGFDVVHLNLHKTFATPHGGGGPGAGRWWWPSTWSTSSPPRWSSRTGTATAGTPTGPRSIGRVHGWNGNFGILVRAFAYLLANGGDGLRGVAERAVLNANYLLERLSPAYQLGYPTRPVMHEFVLSARRQKAQGARGLDIAKGLIDRGFHPPTVYFPLIVEEALMVEPTETESLETLDSFAEAMLEIAAQAETDPHPLHQAPVTAPVGPPRRGPGGPQPGRPLAPAVRARPGRLRPGRRGTARQADLVGPAGGRSSPGSAGRVGGHPAGEGGHQWQTRRDGGPGTHDPTTPTTTRRRRGPATAGHRRRRGRPATSTRPERLVWSDRRRARLPAGGSSRDPTRLADIDPDESEGYQRKKDVADELKRHRDRISDLQARLYGEQKRSLLIVLQAMDTGGKDGTIKGVFQGVNPQGCQVWSFKAPSNEEAAHDFLWRYHQKTPPRGMIHIFNRSHYEDVLIVRVKDLVPESVWKPRYEAINQFEQALTLAGVTVLKFYLHISKEEQKRRLESRLADPDKRWKFSTNDIKERAYWDDYQAAFEDAVNHCSTAYAPGT
jgi:PPK2 family polyphosphate:nucleotide phosphotransferase